jgi:hypothetical protein
MNDASGGGDAGRRRWRLDPRAAAAIVILVAFVVGGLAGASLFREFGHGDHDGGPRFLPGKASERSLARFSKALDLTPTQIAAVDSISRHEFDAVSAVRDETWPRMQTVLDDTRRSIDSILTPDQRTRYHDMLARQEAHWLHEQAERDSASKAAKRP